MAEATGSTLEVEQAQRFFNLMFGGLDDGWLVMSSRLSNFNAVGQWYVPGETFEQAAVTAVAGAAAEDDVYFSCALMGRKQPRGRGTEASALLVPGLWAEVDYELSGMSTAEKLSEGETWDVIRGLVTKPSVIVRSGGGFHLYWLFDKPLLVDTPEAVAMARRANRGMQRMLMNAGLPHLDTVIDLARVLRPPGTKNWKLRETPRDVSIVEMPGHRYAWNELRPYLFSITEEEPVRGFSVPWAGVSEPARLDGMTAGCAWLRHCRDDAATLPEPEWHAMSLLLARVVDGREVMHEWSRPYPGYSVEETDTKFMAAVEANAPVRCQTVRDRAGDSWCRGCEFRTTIVSPVQLGRMETWDEKDRREQPPEVRWLERELTDDGNATRFVDLFGERVRYVPRWKSWLIWDGRRWAVDDRNQDGDLARQTARSIQVESDLIEGDLELKRAVRTWAKSSQSAGRINAITGLSRSDPRLVTTAGELDRHHWLLNCENGTLDLRQGGKLMAADRADLITQCTGVAWDEDARCPLWEGFLSDVTGGDIEMIAFLRRIAGYTLTGKVSEQVFFFLYGSGQNGKGTFIHTLRIILGDYSTTGESGLLMESRGDAHPTGLADLFAKRMVVASESKSGRKLDEEVVKRLTGDDEIKARRLFENNFEFEPTHKLWLMANSKPIINDATFAMWRRLILIPFEVQIPEDRKDLDLRDKLLEQESEGILRWAVEGCREWQRFGLVMPQKVIDATGTYRASEDLVGRFLMERMVVEAGATVTTKDLMGAYGGWCFETSVYQLPTRQFRETLEQRGFSEVKRAIGVDGREGRGFLGLRLFDASHDTSGSI